MPILDLSKPSESFVKYGPGVTESDRRSGKLSLERIGNAVHVSVEGDGPLTDIILRYRTEFFPGTTIALGDAWERSYGDLQWRLLDGSRTMPWYCVIETPERIIGLGVGTGANAFCSWRAYDNVVELRLNIKSGNQPVRLNGRTLEVAKLYLVENPLGKGSFQTLTELCRQLSPSPRLAPEPVYGINDWYYAYGNNTAKGILDDTTRTAELTKDLKNRPYSVIDGGWQTNEGAEGGPWNTGNSRFGDMGKLATEITNLGFKPGIWLRPVLTRVDLPKPWFLKDQTLDPSVPEALNYIKEQIALMHHLGYDLIKHDFSTWDICGQWGFEMGDEPYSAHAPTLTDTSRTTCEVLNAMYAAIRDGAGSSILIGCNTVGHLTAGTHELQRIGDDTSGQEWSRTRKMGVNTLAFRSPQDRQFFATDPDCVGLTTKIPWSLNRQWLELASQSGTPLFVSAEKAAVGDEQKEALKQAYFYASQPLPIGEPLDWRTTLTPEHWKLRGREKRFKWYGGLGYPG